MIAANALSNFFDHPTWPSAIVIAIIAIVVGWVVVTMINKV